MQLRLTLAALLLLAAVSISAQLSKTDGTVGTSNEPPDCDVASTSKLLYDTGGTGFSCGTDVGSSDILLRLSGPISTGANVTPVTLTGMVFSAAAATTYQIGIDGAVSAAAATTGYGFGVDCVQTPVLIALTGYSQLADATGTVTSWEAIADNAILAATSGIPTNATNVAISGGGVIRSHATTAGNCQFLFRSETTAVTTAQAHTVITVRVIP